MGSAQLLTPNLTPTGNAGGQNSRRGLTEIGITSLFRMPASDYTMLRDKNRGSVTLTVIELSLAQQ
jgi:hypothetical protein